MHFNALHLNYIYYAVSFEDFNTLIASTVGIITGSVATGTYSIHHFTCDITKIFQSPLPSLYSLSSLTSSALQQLDRTLHYTTKSQDTAAHYTTPRVIQTRLHIVQYTTRSQSTAAHYTINHEISRHGCILYNTS